MPPKIFNYYDHIFLVAHITYNTKALKIKKIRRQVRRRVLIHLGEKLLLKDTDIAPINPPT